MTISLYGGKFQKNSLNPKISGSNLCLEPKVQVSTIKIGTPIHLGSFGPIGLNFGPTIYPLLVHLTQIFTGVSSNNLMYALVVVSILKNVQ